MAIDGSITLTSRTLVGTLVQSGPHNGDVVLPALALEATAVAEAFYTLPMPTLSATGVAGTVSDGDCELPARTAAGTGLTGNAAAGDITLPARTVSGYTGHQGAAALPAPTLAGAMMGGNTASASIELPALSLDGVLASQGTGTGSVTLPMIALAASMSGAPVASAEITLPAPTVDGEMISGNVGSALITIPMVTLDASTGVMSTTGTASITLPVLQLNGAAIQTLASITYESVVLNTRTRAVSQYSGIAPNSIARFNGVTLMATANGIVALEGDSDHPNAAKIAAHLTTGKSDLDDAGFKRVPTGYVGYRASGNLELTLITDDHHEHVYTLVPRRVEDQQHASRAKFGRGAEGMYWQVKVANTNGADFALDRLELNAASTGRKV